jgi:raffinose/stachyose/melibiose transport system substrate-binding protein
MKSRNLKKLTAVLCTAALAAGLIGVIPASAEEEKTTLTMWHIQTQENVAKTIQDSIDRFEAEYPDVHVEVVPMANDAYKTKLVTAMAAGELPDIFIHWTGGPMKSYVDNGLLYDMTELMNQDGYVDQFLPASIKQATYNDSIWAVPVENVSPALLSANTEILDELGLEIPETLDDFEAVCDALLENGKIPIALANKTKWTAAVIYGFILDRMAGPEAYANAVAGEASFTDEDYIAAAQKMQDWAQKGYFGPDFQALDYDSGQDRNLLYNGDAVFYIMGGWFLFTIQGENPDYLDKIKIVPFPANEDSKGSAGDYIGTIGDNFYSIASTCEAPEMAFKAITYLLDETAVEERIAEGKIPPLKDVELTDPLSIQISEAASSAENVILWCDQYVPNEQAEVLKDALQQMLDGNMTPEEFGEEMDATCAEIGD